MSRALVDLVRRRAGHQADPLSTGTPRFGSGSRSRIRRSRSVDRSACRKRRGTRQSLPEPQPLARGEMSDGSDDPTQISSVSIRYPVTDQEQLSPNLYFTSYMNRSLQVLIEHCN